jgi:hypothetical protein
MSSMGAYFLVDAINSTPRAGSHRRERFAGDERPARPSLITRLRAAVATARPSAPVAKPV